MVDTVTEVPVVRHHRLRNTFFALLGVAAIALVGFGGYWVWTQQDSGVRMRAQLESAQARIAELSDQLKGKGSSTTTVVTQPATVTPAPAANQAATSVPSATPAANGISPQEDAQLNALLLKKAAIILPAPNGQVGTMTQTAKLGTPPSGRGCRKLVGTKHDDATHGTYQMWRPC